jgi:DNA-binding transcriptional MerR regulator
VQGNEEIKIVQMLEQRKFSTRELAAHAGLPVPTVKLLVKEGVLVPSVRSAEGRGRGMVFSADDVTAARALNAVRFQNMGAEPLRQLTAYFRSDEWKGLRSLSEVVPDRPRALFVTSKHATANASLEQVMVDAPVVYCLDVGWLRREVLVSTTEGVMTGEFQEPGSSGRVPPTMKPRVRRARAEKRPSSRRSKSPAKKPTTRGKKP